MTNNSSGKIPSKVSDGNSRQNSNPSSKTTVTAVLQRDEQSSSNNTIHPSKAKETAGKQRDNDENESGDSIAPSDKEDTAEDSRKQLKKKRKTKDPPLITETATAILAALADDQEDFEMTACDYGKRGLSIIQFTTEFQAQLDSLPVDMRGKWTFLP
jgi:hypothetical protein